MKKIIILLIAVFMIVNICSCGKVENGPESMTTNGASETIATSKNTSDTSAAAGTETLSGVLNDDVNIVFISSGRSDSMLIMTDGKGYMIDTGEKAKEKYKLTERVLKIYNIREITGVFLTHTHKDHIGGIKRLSENFKIDCVYSPALHTSSDDIAATVKDLGLAHSLLTSGEKFVINDRVYFDILAPITLDYSEENNNSLVMMLNANGKRVLFTGDMEFFEEMTLLDNDTDLKADILKVANHGNPDASSSRFLNAVSPEYAVICTNRSEDADSANDIIIQSLPQTRFYITDEYTLGIFVNIAKNGSITAEGK